MAFLPYKISNFLEVKSRAIFIFEFLASRVLAIYILIINDKLIFIVLNLVNIFSHTSMNQG